MAKKKGNVYGQVVVYERTYKGTSIGRRAITSTMNKNKRRSYKKYRGQGRWNVLTFIRMVSLFLTRCHKILDKQKEEREAVEVAVCFLKGECSAVYTGHKELKIFILAINGDLDILKDNGINSS